MPYSRSEGEVKPIFTSTQPLSDAVTYSDPINIERGTLFGVWLSAGPASACSAAQLCMWYEESYDNTLANFTLATDIINDFNGLSGVASAITITPVRMPWIRMGLSATNSAVTSAARVTAKLYEQS